MERKTEVSIRLSSENTITLYWNWIIWPYVVIDWLLNFNANIFGNKNPSPWIFQHSVFPNKHKRSSCELLGL